MALSQVNRETKARAECDTSDPSQTGIWGEFLSFDDTQGPSSAVGSCIFALQAQNREDRVFSPTHTYTVNPIQAFAINIPSQNIAVGMLSLLKIQRPESDY